MAGDKGYKIMSSGVTIEQELYKDAVIYSNTSGMLMSVNRVFC